MSVIKICIEIFKELVKFVKKNRKKFLKEGGGNGEEMEERKGYLGYLCIKKLCVGFKDLVIYYLK